MAKPTKPSSLLVKEAPDLTGAALVRFRKYLSAWYAQHARELPWRGVHDPYATWLSEIMLQQTRVATVIERYKEFLRRFPTIHALADAPEDAVLALWSGMGYYRRARMLHRAAQFVVRELDGVLPPTSDELRTLPGIGGYTAAAIASIAFGERIAVVDGNVERVLLRVLGRAEEKSAAGKSRVARVAQELMPSEPKRRSTAKSNEAGDHNQAMMELGATICLPRAPLCLQCPVLELCKTRGEHSTLTREKPQKRRAAHLLLLRHTAGRSEVLLQQRGPQEALMPGMFELPPLPLDSVAKSVPLLRVRHAITNTNYQVEVFADEDLLAAVPSAKEDLHWAAPTQLNVLPLTGLARKCLSRIGFLAL